MNRQDTYKSARGLLMSQLRVVLYGEKAEGSANASWQALADMEDGFVRAYQEAWVETLASWNLADADQRADLRTLIESAFDDAEKRTIQQFDDLSVPAPWVSERAETFRESWSFGTFIGVPDA